MMNALAHSCELSSPRSAVPIRDACTRPMRCFLIVIKSSSDLYSPGKQLLPSPLSLSNWPSPSDSSDPHKAYGRVSGHLLRWEMGKDQMGPCLLLASSGGPRWPPPCPCDFEKSVTYQKKRLGIFCALSWWAF